MNRPPRSYRFVFLLSALALGLILGGYAFYRFRQLTQHLDRILVEQLEQQFGRAVSSGRVTVTRSGHFTIQNLQIAEGSTFKSGAFLQVDRVEGQINVSHLITQQILRQGAPIQEIESIDFYAPKLLIVRQSNGKWDFQELLKKKKPGAKPAFFQGIATIHNGSVRVRDYRARFPVKALPAENQAVSVNGAVDGRQSGNLTFNATGQGVRRAGKLVVSGIYRLLPATGTITSQVQGLDMPYWLRYFFPANKLYSLQTGVGQLAGSIQMVKGKLDYPSLDATVTGGGGKMAVSALTQPLRGLKGTARLKGWAIQASVTGQVDEIPFRLIGGIPDYRHPLLDFRATSDAFEVSRLSRLLAALRGKPWPGITGPVGGSAHITGPINDFTVDARITSPRLVHPDAVAQGVTGYAIYRRGVVQGTVEVRQALGGSLTAQGSYQMSGATHPWSATGRFSGLDVGQAAPPSLSVKGVASGTFDLKGVGKIFNGRVQAAMARGAAGPLDFQAANATATTSGGHNWAVHMTLARGSAKGFDFRSLVADAGVSSAGIALQNARADAFRGRLKASGQIGRSGDLNLKVNADNVRLAELLAPVKQTGATGIATFDGRLTGNSRSPLLVGHVAARNGTLNGLPYSQLAGNLRATPAGIGVTDASLRAAGGRLALNGDLSVRKNGLGPLNVTARLQNLPLRILDRFHIGKGQGLALSTALRRSTVTGTVQASGTPPHLTLAFNGVRAALPEGSVAVNGKVTTQGKGAFSRLTARVDHVPASAVRGVTWNGKPLVALPPLLKETWVSGTAQFTGPFNNLQGSGDLQVGPVTLRGPKGESVLVQQATGHVTFRGKTATVENAAFDVDGKTFTGSGQYAFGGPLQFNLSGQGLPLERLEPFIGAYARVTGSGAITVNVHGKLNALIVEGHIDAGPLTVDGVRFDRLAGDLRWENGQAAFNNLLLERGGTALEIPTGQFNPKTGEVAATLNLIRFDLNALSEMADESPFLQAAAGEKLRLTLAQIPSPRQGIVDGEIHLSGPLNNLIVSANVTGVGLLLGTTFVDRAALDGTWSPQSLRITQATLNTKDVHFSGQGSLIPGESVDASARLTDSDIQATTALVESVPSLRSSRVGRQILEFTSNPRNRVSGRLEVALALAGDPDNPQGTLNFSTQEFAIGPQPFQVARGAFTLRDRRMVVNELRLEGGDAYVTVSGSGSLSGELNFDLNVYNFNAQLLAPWVGLPPDATGVVDLLSVSVTGTQDQPILQASLNAHDVGTKQYAIDRVQAVGIRAEGDRLDIDRLELVKRPPSLAGEELKTTLTASLPIQFSPLGIPGAGAIRIHADMDRQDLGILTALSPEIKSASGVFTGSLDATGTFSHPLIQGTLALENTGFQLAGFKNHFQNINGKVSFNENRMATLDLHGEATNHTPAGGGAFSATGTVNLASFPKSPLDLHLAAENLYLEGDNVSHIFGEKFRGHLLADVSVKGTLDSPLVGGGLTVRQTDLTLPDRPFPTGPTAAPTFPVNVRFNDFQINAEDKFTVKRGGFNASISGQLALNGSMLDPRVTGRFIIDNGKVRIATKTFKVEDGGVLTISFHPPDPTRIRMDLEATTRVYTYDYTGFEKERKSYQVTIHMTGPMEDPHLDFESDPPDLSRQQILAALGYQQQIEALLKGGQGADQAFRQGLAEAFTGMIIPSVFDPIEDALARALGLEEFGLSYDLDSTLHVNITKQIWKKFFVSYQRQLSGSIPEFQLKLYYRLTHRVSLSYTTDERHVNTWAVEGRLRF